MSSKVQKLESRKPAANLDTPTDLSDAAVREISKAINGILADSFALYLKTKNFHWHVSGPNFRDYHLMLDEHAEAIFATTDPLAERVRKIGGVTLRSISDISKHQSIKDNNESEVDPLDMLKELMADNKAVAKALAKPSVTEKLTALAIDPATTMSREEFAGYVRNEVASSAALSKTFGQGSSDRPN